MESCAVCNWEEGAWSKGSDEAMAAMLLHFCNAQQFRMFIDAEIWLGAELVFKEKSLN